MISKTRFIIGIITLVVGQLSTLLIPIFTNSNLSTIWKAIVSFTLFFVTPQIGIILAIVILGKAGYSYLMRIISKWFKKYGPAEHVSKTRYIVGLFMFATPLFIGWIAPYISFIVPITITSHVTFAVTCDLLLLASIFVLGGEFWDKLRSIFIHKAMANIPQQPTK